jgi:hypothetical protein
VDSVTTPVVQARPPGEFVAEELGVQTRVVLVKVGESAVIVPLANVPSVTVTTDSPLTVDISMVALKYAVLLEDI